MSDGENGDAPGNGQRSGDSDKFGKCCEELREAIEGDGFEPLITVGPDGILYAAVGLIEMDEDEPGMIDHPIFFCPFCGTKVQDRDVVHAQISSEGELQQ